jgi:WD40 repeat protein
MNHPSERIQALLRQARRGGNARWLRPQMTSLASQAGAETTGPAGHVGPIIATAMTADGRLLVSAGDDRTVRLWNTVTGTLLRTFRAPAGVATITTTPDELRVIAALDDGAFAAWDLSLAK